MSVIAPQNFAQLEQALSDVVEDKTPICVTGLGTKAGLGNPSVAEAQLDLSSLCGIIEYEPEELILTAHAATPLAEIEAALASKNQMLAFEPPHFQGLYQTSSSGSIGGALMANLSGPRRLSQGAARDFLLGFQGVSGRGTSFRSGSKVVKNVTGYDLSKLLCGSFGTLAVIDEITLKTLPAPQMSLSLMIAHPELDNVAKAARAALQTAYEPSAIALLPQGVHKLSQNASVAVIRLEGVEISVTDRFEKLKEVLCAYGHPDKLDYAASQNLWQEIRDVSLLDNKGQIWRISTAPSQGPALWHKLKDMIDMSAYFDWAGGLLWLSCDDEGAHEIIRSQLASHGGGHATLMCADEALRHKVSVFEPLPKALTQLNQRVQHAFDPYGLLNPGRL